MTERSQDSAWLLVFGCWGVASVSSLGALFFCEIMELPPCVLCWYQRVFMFPLVLLLPVGLFPFAAARSRRSRWRPRAARMADWAGASRRPTTGAWDGSA